MTLYKKDGTPYAPLGSLHQFDPGSVTNDLLDSYDREMIQLGGSQIYYYEVFIGQETIDPLYVESRGKFWAQTPVILWAWYEAIASQGMMSMYGIDSPDSMLFHLNYKDTLARLNKLPTVGSRIFTPHLRENWEIRHRKTGGFQRWNVMHIELSCVRFQEDAVTNPGEVKQSQLPFDIFGNPTS